jgi:hypothetical protein
MAAPHVSASAALLMSLGADNAKAESLLIDTADSAINDADPPGRDDRHGHGLIRPLEAVRAYLLETAPAACDSCAPPTDQAKTFLDVAAYCASLAPSDDTAAKNAMGYATFAAVFAQHAMTSLADASEGEAARAQHGQQAQTWRTYALWYAAHAHHQASLSDSPVLDYTEVLAEIAISELIASNDDAERCAVEIP